VSLKAFHIFFVTLSVMLAVGFTIWALNDYRTSERASSLVGAGISSVGAIGMIVYGRWFLQKLRRQSYL